MSERSMNMMPFPMFPTIKAIKLGLSMDQDLAMAKLNLAGIAMTKRRKREAQILLTEAKKLDKHGMLKEQMTMMKQQMKKI